jgi:hypothetical protein
MISLGEAHDWPEVYPIFIESYLDDDRKLTEKQERQLRRTMTENSVPGRRWMNAELIAMLLAHTPNVQHISIQGSRDWPTFGLAGSSLSALGVTHMPVKRLDLGMTARPLIKLSGNLETLNLHETMVNLENSMVEMPCLKTLRITGSFLTAERLLKLMGACTGGLVAFEYEAAQG